MSVLGLLYAKRVMATEVDRDNNTVEFYEICDNCFGVNLTKEQILQLSEELKLLAESLK